METGSSSPQCSVVTVVTVVGFVVVVAYAVDSVVGCVADIVVVGSTETVSSPQAVVAVKYVVVEGEDGVVGIAVGITVVVVVVVGVVDEENCR